MQHGCNKKIVRRRNPRNRQEAIETADRQDAVEWLELAVMRARASVERHRVLATDRDHEPTVTLPLAIAEMILACAKDGMRKGQGRGRPRNTRRHELAEAAVVAWAWRRQRELMDRDLIAPDTAEEQAAEDARKHAFEQYGLSRRRTPFNG